MEKKNHYHYAIDGMRVIAILAVIGIHTSSCILDASGFAISKYPWAFFFNQILRFAVPLFFMISGFVLEVNYPFHQNYLKYLQKRFTRILLPYLFWSGIYLTFIHSQPHTPLLKILFFGTASYQLYFIPTLLLFYLLFPLIHRYYHFIANKGILIVLGIVQLLLLRQEYYIKPLTIAYPIEVALLNIYIFILGIVASHHYQTILHYIKKWKIFVLLLYSILGGIVVFEAKLLYEKTHNYWYFYTQWRPIILAYSVMIGGLLYAALSKKNKYQPLIHLLSKLSFFVFFIHIMILEWFWNLVGHTLFVSTRTIMLQDLWYSVCFFLVVAGISYTIAYVAHKIPFLAKISG